MKEFIYKSIIQPFARIYWSICKPKTYGARVIVLNDNEVLLVKNANILKWSLPGGKIEHMETPQECALREVYEELRLHIDMIKYKLGTYVSKKEGKRDTIYIFVAEVANKKFDRQWEIDDAQWFPLDALPEDLTPATLRRLMELKNGRSNILGLW